MTKAISFLKPIRRAVEEKRRSQNADEKQYRINSGRNYRKLINKRHHKQGFKSKRDFYFARRDGLEGNKFSDHVQRHLPGKISDYPDEVMYGYYMDPVLTKNIARCAATMFAEDKSTKTEVAERNSICLQALDEFRGALRGERFDMKLAITGASMILYVDEKRSGVPKELRNLATGLAFAGDKIFVGSGIKYPKNSFVVEVTHSQRCETGDVLVNKSAAVKGTTFRTKPINTNRTRSRFLNSMLNTPGSTRNKVSAAYQSLYHAVAEERKESGETPYVLVMNPLYGSVSDGSPESKKELAEDALAEAARFIMLHPDAVIQFVGLTESVKDFRGSLRVKLKAFFPRRDVKRDENALAVKLKEDSSDSSDAVNGATDAAIRGSSSVAHERRISRKQRSENSDSDYATSSEDKPPHSFVKKEAIHDTRNDSRSLASTTSFDDDEALLVSDGKESDVGSGSEILNESQEAVTEETSQKQAAKTHLLDSNSKNFKKLRMDDAKGEGGRNLRAEIGRSLISRVIPGTVRRNAEPLELGDPSKSVSSQTSEKNIPIHRDVGRSSQLREIQTKIKAATDRFTGLTNSDSATDVGTLRSAVGQLCAELSNIRLSAEIPSFGNKKSSKNIAIIEAALPNVVDILNNLQLAKISTNNDIEIWIKQLVATLNALEKLSSLPNQKEARRQKMIVKSKEGVGAIAESNVSNSEASESASAHIAIANDSRQIKSSGIEGQLQDVRNQIDVAVNPLRAVLKNYSTDKLISLYPFAEQVAPLFRDVESILLKIAAFESMSLDDEQSAVVENMHKVMMSCKVALKGAQEKIWTASSVDARKSVRNDLQRIVAMMDELPKAPSAKTFEKKRLPKRRESTVGSESNPKKIGKSGADKARETSFVSKPAVEKINFHRPHEEMAPAVIAEAAGRILKKWKREKKLTGKEVLRDLRNILNEWIDLRNLDLERGIKPLSGNFDKLMSIYTDVERAGTSNEKFGVALSPAGGVLEAIRSSSAENN